MNLDNEISLLQEHLDELALVADEELLSRYGMRRPRRPPGLYWQMRWIAGRILRWFGSLGIIPSDPWPASLKHAQTSRKARPLLIWAVGADRSSLRKACGAFATMLDDLPGFAPVLVTDVADFAFFSRLGWLVEYLPGLTGPGEDFQARKARYLARLYQGMPAVPVGLGLEPASRLDELRRLLSRSS